MCYSLDVHYYPCSLYSNHRQVCSHTLALGHTLAALLRCRIGSTSEGGDRVSSAKTIWGAGVTSVHIGLIENALITLIYDENGYNNNDKI